MRDALWRNGAMVVGSRHFVEIANIKGHRRSTRRRSHKEVVVHVYDRAPACIRNSSRRWSNAKQVVLTAAAQRNYVNVKRRRGLKAPASARERAAARNRSYRHDEIASNGGASSVNRRQNAISQGTARRRACGRTRFLLANEQN